MSCNAGPVIPTSNLVLDFDAANSKSYMYYPSASTDHGISNWYCFVSGTATYSIITANVSIFQNNNGVITTVVAGTANPQRGTVAVTQGCTYYGNGPIFLLVEDQQHSITPTSLAGTKFIYLSARNGPGTIYVYSPYATTVVSFYDATANGVNSTATSTVTIHKGESAIITQAVIGNWCWISSTNPIIASVTQNGADKTVLVPASSYVYNRYLAYYNTTVNSTATSTIGTYVVYDTTYPIMNMTIADGAGGDCCQGLGYQHLCDTYSWGNACSDYVIVAPYNVTVTASYWSGSAWVVWETHVLTGTQTSPGYVARDGTLGVGVAATVINGAAAYMASGATLWKWEGTNPFYICINDTADGEFSMMGWMAAKTQRTSADYALIDSVSGTIGTLVNGPTYSSLLGGSIIFDGSNYISCGNLGTFYSTGTISMWINSAVMANWNNCFHTHYTGSASNVGIRFEETALGGFYVVIGNDSATYTIHNYITSGMLTNTWYNIVLVWNVSGNNVVGYLNGTQVFNEAQTYWATTLPTVTIGAGYGGARLWNGSISNVGIYNTALTADDVLRNFNALRGRFNI